LVLIVGANEYAAHEIKRRLKTDSGFVRYLEELVHDLPLEVHILTIT
jgi:hypothetical protein